MRKRSFFVWAAIVGASLIAVHLEPHDLGRPADARRGLLARGERRADRRIPHVRQAVSVYLVERALRQRRRRRPTLEQRLPARPQAAGRTGRRRAARGPATDAVDRLLAAPRVQAAVDQRELARAAKARQRARGQDRVRGSPPATASVTLDLGELVDAGRHRARHVLVDARDRSRPTRAQITDHAVGPARRGADRRQGAARPERRCCCVLVAGLYALAVYLAARRAPADAAQRRLGARRSSGWWRSWRRRVAGDVRDRRSSPRPSPTTPGERAWLIGSSILGQIGLGGDPLRRDHRRSARVLAGPDATRDGGAPPDGAADARRPARASPGPSCGGAYLLLVLWGPTHALRTCVGHPAPRRAARARGSPCCAARSLREFPDAERGRHRPAARPGDRSPSRPEHAERRSRPPRAAEIDVDQPWHCQRRCRSPRSDEIDVPAGGGCYRRRATRRLVRRATLWGTTGSPRGSPAPRLTRSGFGVPPGGSRLSSASGEAAAPRTCENRADDHETVGMDRAGRAARGRAAAPAAAAVDYGPISHKGLQERRAGTDQPEAPAAGRARGGPEGNTNAVKAASDPASSLLRRVRRRCRSSQSGCGADKSKRNEVKNASATFADRELDVTHLRASATVTIGKAQKLFGTNWKPARQPAGAARRTPGQHAEAAQGHDRQRRHRRRDAADRAAGQGARASASRVAMRARHAARGRPPFDGGTPRAPARPAPRCVDTTDPAVGHGQRGAVPRGRCSTAYGIAALQAAACRPGRGSSRSWARRRPGRRRGPVRSCFGVAGTA